MRIQTQVEFVAPPEVVRETLLDFPNISQWHSGLVKKITPLADDADPKAEGRKLHCEMDGFTFDSVITGPLVFGLVAGRHMFGFYPSDTTSGVTTFVQREDYKGVGTFLMSQFLLGGKIKGQFEKFNEDLKRKVEAKM